ncbi:hypothetical protein [Maridesulfovibrio sp.]|uniref:hypothetical protein n=1 Tax=Maridesulfovibrio sp. TaxID=2795000 RepID=UPI002A1899F5|nr:hypothetical protein [Maridesulfovibrio sp.]
MKVKERFIKQSDKKVKTESAKQLAVKPEKMQKLLKKVTKKGKIILPGILP